MPVSITSTEHYANRNTYDKTQKAREHARPNSLVTNQNQNSDDRERENGSEPEWQFA